MSGITLYIYDIYSCNSRMQDKDDESTFYTIKNSMEKEQFITY